MSLVKVTSEDLHALSGRVQAGSNAIQEQHHRLQADVSSVVGGDWQGMASSQFNALFDEWHRSATGLKDALDGIARLVQSAGTQYQTTEDAVRSSMV